VAERSGLIRLAVFGLPVARSLSPAIHRQFAQQFGLAIDYRAIETGPEEFIPCLKELILAGGRGCNVTVPLKHQAWQFARRSSRIAQQAQAANTLVFDGPEDCFADNTDGRGLIRDLSGYLSTPLANSRIAIIGAGGAAAGILGDLLQQTPAEIVLANRSLERARSLVLRFAAFGRLSCCTLDQLDAQGSFELVINATSLGHSGRCPDLPAALFAPDGLCYDLNYGQAADPLRTWCNSAGIRYQDGLGMLVEQAAVSFALWTAKHPDSGPVLQRLRQRPSHGGPADDA
jgi:shikimate dehydrogenase